MVPVNARRLARLGILLSAWLSATGAIGTCPFFKPTQPESPNRPPIIPDYSSPAATLLTMAKGVEDKSTSNGQSVYMDALAESSAADPGDGRAFHAFFDLRDLQEHSTSWDRNRDWNKQLEPVMYSDLVRKYSYPYLMTWEPNEACPQGNCNDTESSTDALLHRKYRIMGLVKQGTTTDTLPVAIGAADLYFVKSAKAANKWVIALWQDFAITGADTATLGKFRLVTQ